MNIKVKVYSDMDYEVLWEKELPTRARRKLEAKRNKKLICASCRKEITEDTMKIVHLKDIGNVMVHIKCPEELYDTIKGKEVNQTLYYYI